MLLGVNEPQYATVSANVTGLTCVEIFENTAAGTNGVPNAFPGSQQPLPNTSLMPLITFNPDIPTTLAGLNDALLVTYFNSAPPGTMFMVNHEGNDPGNSFPGGGLGYKTYVNYIFNLIKRNNIPVLFGQNFGSGAVKTGVQHLEDWVLPGMDWYGYDAYQSTAAFNVHNLFDAAFNIIYDITNKIPGITETNSNIDPAAWLNTVYPWALQNNIPHLITHWDTTTYIWSPAFAAAMNQFALQAAGFAAVGRAKN